MDKNSTTDPKPTLKDWLSNNPHKGVNDYYQLYGNSEYESTTSPSPTSQMRGRNTKRNFSSILPFILLAILGLLFYLAYDNTTKSFSFNKLAEYFDIHSKDKKEIKNQIETTYFGLINGAYTAEGIKGIGAENLPFYNQDLKTLIVMGFMPFITLAGNVQVEPKNIEISDVNDETASATYELTITKNNKTQTFPIKMIVKKIGGHWKLDGQTFLPFNQLNK
jgi:hypothetical protein